MSTAAAPVAPGLQTPPAWRRALSRIRAALGAFEDVARNRDLRHLQLAFLGSVIGSWAFGVALAVYAYKIDGAAGVGLAVLIRTIPSALAGPFTSALADRHARVRVMITSDLLRGALFAAMTIAVIAGAPSLLVYVLAGFVMLAATPFHPAQSALLPQLTRTPEELTASNVVSSTVESTGFFLGPALGGLLLVATSPQGVFVASALTCLWSAAMLIGIREEERPSATAVASAEGFVRHALGGFRAARDDRDIRLLLILFAAQTLVAGALTVLVVVLALEMLFAGEAGVGYLNAAVGIGGVLGAAAAASLVRGRRLAGGFLVGMFLWGAPLVVIGLAPSDATGYLMLAAIGIGNTVVDVAGLTLLQRAVPDEVMARVFGVLETLLMATVGLGALLTPALIGWIGREETFIAIGSLLPIITVAAHGDPPQEPLELLQGNAIFKPLALVTQEQLAERFEERAIAGGETVIRQGDPGDRFYVIADGVFHVETDGVRTADLGHGDCFGEIALLRDSPRTATVTAAPAGGRVYALDRAPFLAAVNGTVTGSAAADELAETRVPVAMVPRRVM
jgi:MFS family permease